jgi:uncharacterized protein with NRDE domain
VCTILFSWQPGAPTAGVLVANRDELRSRPSDPPMRLRDEPDLWGGRDRLAGGTWLAVDRAGRLCAVTNRHLGEAPSARDASRRSRGELPLRVLEAGDEASTKQLLESLNARAYNPVNVLYLSRESAWWVGLDDKHGRQFRDVAPGVHALSVQDLDDPADPKTRRLLEQAGTAAAGASADPHAVRDRFAALLRSHEQYGELPQSAACIHGDEYGTVSSATVVIGLGGAEFRHAEGPPCVTDYRLVGEE